MNNAHVEDVVQIRDRISGGNDKNGDWLALAAVLHLYQSPFSQSWEECTYKRVTC